ncbi:Efflux pump vrtL [Spathaspora sp. JA1]|nr:Efflux pump vrtL [Spathaspora sp. JA1]
MSTPSIASDIEKGSPSHVEGVPIGITADIDPEHEQYLISRHGSVQLDPLPSADPQDPLNWPDWKKNYEILLIAFGTFSSTFMAAGLTPAFETMAEEYGVPLTTAAYFTSAQIAVFGVLPLLWVPLMNTYGRKFFLTFGAFACGVLNIGGALSTTFNQQMATRVLVGVFVSTATAAGSSVVGDLAFSHERGKKNGWWSLALVIGTPAGPFFTGFIQQHAGTKWIFYVFAIMNFVQFGLWMFATETVYTRSNPEYHQSKVLKYMGIRKSESRKFDWKMFFRPLKQAANFNISIAVLAASVTFCYANIVLVVEMPQVMIPYFHLTPQQLSLQYISIIVGSIIGEILAGPLSDWWMKRSITKRNGHRVIVDRLWISYNGYLLVIVGLIIWGVFLFEAKPGHWNIRPLIGAAIAAAGNNIVATVITTFAIDSKPEKAADIGLYINFVRSLYGFLGPFYFPYMFENLNFAGSAGLMSALVLLFAWVPTILAHFVGLRREKN